MKAALQPGTSVSGVTPKYGVNFSPLLKNETTAIPQLCQRTVKISQVTLAGEGMDLWTPWPATPLH